MDFKTPHTFHIPVLGIAYSIDTPLKVARFGISSVVSIADDELLEKLRSFYCSEYSLPFHALPKHEDDYRAKRITAYLNMMDVIIKQQMAQLRTLPFEAGNELEKYFEMLPDGALKQRYNIMLQATDKVVRTRLQEALRNDIVAGAIDVNIMAKVDKLNVAKDGTPLPQEYSDALAALRGFANSTLQSSLVLSAGYNPRLYAYIEFFDDFYPDVNGRLKKKLILKLSDYRSANIQGKLLAKKGLWISEFRIESGLNCGGHAFATDGLLMGPILEDFKLKRDELKTTLFELCNTAIATKGGNVFENMPAMRITVQGGIGTVKEHNFLMQHYGVDGTGWGSPFLLVPEATNVDEETLHELATAVKEDYFLSNASPLGVPFNNFRKSSSEKKRKLRIEKGRPGSPCYKKYLVSDTEFTDKPVCTASRIFQLNKIQQLEARQLSKEEFDIAYNSIIEKDCLCEGLGAPVLLKNHLQLSHGLSAVTICPGPNLAYFSGTFPLSSMVSHIYGRFNALNASYRPHMFVNELAMYVEYYKKELLNNIAGLNEKKIKYLQTFKANLKEGIDYYKGLLPQLIPDTINHRKTMYIELCSMEMSLD